MRDGSLIPRFGRARRDPGKVVLEGFHPLKHALRFDAAIEDVVCTDLDGLDRLSSALAPELTERIQAIAQAVDPAVFAQLAPLAPTTGVMALAARPTVDPAAALTDVRPLPAVLLEDPRDLGNVGACIRVAAAAEAAGVLTTGSHDPWHPDAVRGAAGLHFALPVARVESLESLSQDLDRPLYAVDPDGDRLDPSTLPPRALLAFGTERHGLSDALSARADAKVSIPMRPGVSSLNLATSVAAVLFAWRLLPGGVPPRAP